MSDEENKTEQPMAYGDVAFKAYNDAKGGLTYDGKPIPPWEDVGDDVRAAWNSAAEKVAFAVMDDLAKEPQGLVMFMHAAFEKGLPVCRERSIILTRIEEAGLWIGALIHRLKHEARSGKEG